MTFRSMRAYRTEAGSPVESYSGQVMVNVSGYRAGSLVCDPAVASRTTEEMRCEEIAGLFVEA